MVFAFGGSILFALIAVSNAEEDLSGRYRRIGYNRVRVSVYDPPRFSLSQPEIAELWPLRNAKVSALTMKMLNENERDRTLYPGPIGVVLGAALYADYTVGIEWICDHFDQLNATGRVQMASALSDAPCIESVELLLALLEDKRNDGFGPNPKTLSWHRSRVCDDALSVLAGLLHFEFGLPDVLSEESLVQQADHFRFVPPDDSERRWEAEIFRFLLWWRKHSGRIRAEMPRFLESEPRVRAKLDAIIRKIRRE